MRLTNDDIKVVYLIKDYLWLNRPYELNIFGIRGYSPDGFNDNTLNQFNDTIGVSFIDYYQNSHLFLWKSTCDPGIFYINNPMNVNGTAKLVAGQYVDTYKIDYHRGKYLALCERLGPVLLERIKTKEDFYRTDNPREVSYSGINIHKSFDEVESVNQASAGCTVFYSVSEFDIFMAFCHKHSHLYGNKFTYTLLEHKDFMES